MQHIILIGFKHSGKSSIAELLAEELGRPYIDLDQAIEEKYLAETGSRASCRDIMKEKGLAEFRLLETRCLEDILRKETPAVVALGGGAPLAPENQQLIDGHTVIHVTADPGRVYERIAMNGRPAFFPAGKSFYEGFRELWDTRKQTYEELADLTVMNDGSLDHAVRDIKASLPQAT